MRLFSPTNVESTATFRFMRYANERHGLHLLHYEDLYSWSTDNLAAFWNLVWDFTNIVGTKPSSCLVVDESASPQDNPSWFPQAWLNYAENLLQCRSPHKIALIQATESTPHQSLHLKRLSYAQLYNSVNSLASALLDMGLSPGDRVASYASNCIENVIACLAATSLGCIWVAAAADFGPEGVYERLEQVHPKVIFVVDALVYNGRVHDHTPKVKALLALLRNKRNLHPKTVVIHPIPQPAPSTDIPRDWIPWSEFLIPPSTPDIPFVRLPFDHPLWILFSSGTTGKPKPIVHRSGGMLLQSRKELAICADLSQDDVFFYYTTTGWMMFNFLIAGLSLSSTLVLYDGSPLKDPSILWTLTEKCGISVFGTSAKYLDHLSKVYKPREHHNLSTLRHIYSTGSPLSPQLFDFVYQDIKPEILLGSITGGTDICSLFAGMNSALPVFRGEIQCRMLGMAVESFDPAGKVQAPDQEGELVCLRPFPCEPLGFWPLPGFGTPEEVAEAQERFRRGYFDEYPGIWYHGDHILITSSREHNAGGVVMLGRSDGVLNPGGVRFGTSEIYEILDARFSAGGPNTPIIDALAVGRAILNGTDEEVVLFVQLEEGQSLSENLILAIKTEIRRARSPRHVPAKILQAPAIPYTLNGKKVEVLIKKILSGYSADTVNLSTLANPECLSFYVATYQDLCKE